MKKYHLDFSNSAASEFKKLPKELQLRISYKIESLKETPFPSGVQKIMGAEDTYRIRIGDYRVVYFIKGDFIEIMRVKHRKEVYRKL